MNRLRLRLPRGSDWINPIVVKELRQAVRSWSVTGILLLFLVIALVVMIVFLLGYSVDMAAYGSASTGMGRTLFGILQSLLMLTMLLFVPAYTMVRLSAERSDINIDLLFATTISPWAIVRGKLFAGLYLNVLFLSACMPFMVFSYLLRGIDLPSILLSIATTFLISILAIQAGILLACLPMSRTFRILLIVVAGFLGLGTLLPLGIMAGTFAHAGMGSRLGTADFWKGVAASLSLGACVLSLLHVLAAALIAPPHANRALPIRLCLLAIWLISGVVTFCLWLQAGSRGSAFEAWSFCFVLIASVSLLFTIGETEARSIRVRRAIPRRRLWRLPAFLLYSGPGGGMLFVTLLALASPAIALALHHGPTLLSGGGAGPRSDTDLLKQFALYLYVLSYTLTALFLRRVVLRNRIRSSATGALAMIVAAVVIAGPFIGSALFGRADRTFMHEVALGNLFALTEDGRLSEHLCVAAVWAILAFLLNGRWFVEQVRDFRPPDVRRVPSAPPPLPLKTEAPGRLDTSP